MSHSRATMAHRLRRRASLALEFKVLSRKIASQQSMTGRRRAGAALDRRVATLLAMTEGAPPKARRKTGALHHALLLPAMTPSLPASVGHGALRRSKVSGSSVKRCSLKATARLCKSSASVSERICSGQETVLPLSVDRVCLYCKLRWLQLVGPQQVSGLPQTTEHASQSEGPIAADRKGETSWRSQCRNNVVQPFSLCQPSLRGP